MLIFVIHEQIPVKKFNYKNFNFYKKAIHLNKNFYHKMLPIFALQKLIFVLL